MNLPLVRCRRGTVAHIISFVTPTVEPTASPTCPCPPDGVDSLGEADAGCTTAGTKASTGAHAQHAQTHTAQSTSEHAQLGIVNNYRKLVAVSEQSGSPTATLHFAEYTDPSCAIQLSSNQVVQQVQDTVQTSKNVTLKVLRRHVTEFPPTLPGRYTVGFILRYCSCTSWCICRAIVCHKILVLLICPVLQKSSTVQWPTCCTVIDLCPIHSLNRNFGADNTCGGSPYEFFVGTDRCANYVDFYGRVRCNPKGTYSRTVSTTTGVFRSV